MLRNIVSVFRSIDRQVVIFARKLAAGQTLEQILRVSAPPVFGEHHTGRAVDIGTLDCQQLETEFEATPAFRWLSANAQQFGLALSYPPDNRHGYNYGPWQWCHHPLQDQKPEEFFR